MRKLPQKSNGTRGTPDALDVSLRTAFCLLNNEGRNGSLPYLRLQFQRVGLDNPTTTWTYRAQQAIRKKGAYPKISLTPANVSAGTRVSTGTHSHPASMLAWPLCSPGAHIPPGVRLAQCPISPGARVSTGTHTSTMLVFHSTTMFT
mgnify:CR=1 FL=1